jgi:cholesterol transport system auxiliary component
MASIAVLALAGCAGLSAKDAQRYFVLEAAPARAAPVVTRSSTTLLIAPTSASAFYDTQEIVFSRVSGQRAYYQLSSWTEPPARTFDRLLVARLEASGAFATVVHTTSGVRGTLLLKAHLVEMFHDATHDPGQVRIWIEAELSDPVMRKMVVKQNFVVAAPTPSADAVGAVQAFDVAVTAILDEVSAWTIEHASAAPLPSSE